MIPALLVGAALALAQPGGDPEPGPSPGEATVYLPGLAPAPAAVLASKPSTNVFPPTYANTPTPFGDFPGPSFGPSTPDRFPLMMALQGTIPGDLLDSNRTQLTGWIDMSVNGSSARRDNLPMGFDNRANDFVVQQNFFRLERAVDTGSKQPDWGFRTEWIAPGIDARYTVARGLLEGPKEDRKRIYGFDPMEFYLDLWFPDLAQGTMVRIGRFLDLGGYETIPSVSNLLNSHSYMYIYTPFTQAGAYAITKLDAQWYVAYGVVLGNDVFIDPTDQAMFIGGVKWVSLAKTDSVWFTTYFNGGNYFGPRQRDNVQYFDVIWTHVVTPRFQIITEAQFVYQTAVPDLKTITAYGIDGFLEYDFTPRCYGAIRPEVWMDSQGQRTGFKGLYTALTAGFTFKPRNWLFLRPEVRFDHNCGATGPYEGKHNLFTVCQDVVVRW
jgi:hypothetical protein